VKVQKHDIGIAILSTDRPNCLSRLLQSINKHTNKKDLCVFVVDDSSKEKDCLNVCKSYKWVSFSHTGERIGVAKNTNEALSKISSFKYKIILNNDVEILRVGWEYYYFLSMQQTGFHHFCFQQEGLWGAGTEKRPQEIKEYNGRSIKTLHNFPQGAILTLDDVAFNTIGYFDDKSFKSYGYAHWDFSFRISESGIQPKGVHDVIGSNDYFKVHDEKCTTPVLERIKYYKKNEQVFKDLFDDVKKGKRDFYISYQGQ